MQTHASRLSVSYGRLDYPSRRTALVSLIGMAVLATAPEAQAHGTQAGDLLLDHAYAVPSVLGETNGKAHFRGIKNAGGQADRLLSASTPIAAGQEGGRVVPVQRQHGRRVHIGAQVVEHELDIDRGIGRVIDVARPAGEVRPIEDHRADDRSDRQ